MSIVCRLGQARRRRWRGPSPPVTSCFASGGRRRPCCRHPRRPVAMSEHPPPQEAHWPEGTIFTLGHSTLPIERFVAVLQAYAIARLADIRTIPRSRHNPQFNDTTLADSLKALHLDYVHVRALGGLRHPRKVSPNT